MISLLGDANVKVASKKVIDSPALQVICYFNAQNRIIKKIENDKHWEYAYDFIGHLTKVKLNGKLIEEYFYNNLGQRVKDNLSVFAKEREHYYLGSGLYKANTDNSYAYDSLGNLFAISNRYTKNNYYYDQACRICAAKISNIELICYDYESDKSFLPYQKRIGNKIIATYSWKDIRLVRFFDAEKNLEYNFDYETSNYPKFITITGNYIKQLTGILSYTFKCGTDQVGTLKRLAKTDNTVFKEIIFDSFGNVISDSQEELFIPIGFAGGLRDKHTGFTRFCFRDYDPSIGRFVSQDPAYDLRGDSDLYDYCIDDPVNKIDILGLQFTEAAAAAGGASHAGISHPFGGPHQGSGASSDEKNIKVVYCSPLTSTTF